MSVPESTLVDLVTDVLETVYSYAQVKDRILLLVTDVAPSDGTLAVSPQDSLQVQRNMVLQLCVENSSASELVRVMAVNTTTGLITVQRGVRNTTGQAWAAATAMVHVEPEYPISSIVREINHEIVGIVPDIWCVKNFSTTVSAGWQIGYNMPSDCQGINKIEYYPSGTQNFWEPVRRYRYDFTSQIVTILTLMQPGRPMNIIYRGEPTGMTADTDTVAATGLPATCDELLVLGTAYRLISKRTSGRLVDTRAETPLTGQYRQPSFVQDAVKSLFAMYQQRLQQERERQRLRYPIPMNYTF